MEDESSDPEMIPHLDPFTRAHLELPLEEQRAHTQSGLEKTTLQDAVHNLLPFLYTIQLKWSNAETAA